MRFVLISWVNLNLVVAKEIIYEGYSLMAGTIIDNLVDDGRWKVIFGIGVTEIAKVCTDTNGALFFVNRDGIGDP
jgi:hypothetical protein